MCAICVVLSKLTIITYSFTHRAMGTSVNLKNTYAGYSIDLIVKHEAVQDMINLVGQQIPGEYCIVSKVESRLSKLFGTRSEMSR